MNRTGYFAFLLAAGSAICQAPPAPTVDRVGFPADYASKFHRLYRFDRPDTRQVRTIYGNEAAASVEVGQGLTYPYGSVIVMETWPALFTAAGEPVLDDEGRYQKNPAGQATLFVMRKEPGFGEAYGPNRNGEWEYVAYRPDGSYQTRPEASASCAVCHLQAEKTRDWTFRVLPFYIQGGSGAPADMVIKDYKYLPGVLRIGVGATVTLYNDDLIEHTVTDTTPRGGDSGAIPAGKSISIRFTQRGEFTFGCRLHPAMRGRIIVE